MRLFLVLILLSKFSFAQNAEVAKIESQLEKLRLAMLSPEEISLSNLVSDELVYVHSSGTVRNKQGFVDEFIKGWTVLKEVEFQEQFIDISGKDAIVRHRWVGKTKMNNSPGEIDIIILMVWRKEKGQWRMYARQAAKVPEEYRKK